MSTRLLKLLDPESVTRSARRAVDRATLRAVDAIMSDIDSRGNAAVLEHAARLGDIQPASRVVFDRDALAAALDRLPVAQRAVLVRTASRICAFAEAQRACLRDLAVEIEGGWAGHTCLPVRTAGCYAPGGRFPLPSSVLMTALTARVAGVERVWVASPRPPDATLAAASIAGADGLLAIGGAQAIGALAGGLCGVPACDMIVGPGNRWVTAAKLLVSDRVGIDMLAGPSELVVLADASAEPALVAGDLLAQAEHDDDAAPILVTTAPHLPDAVEAELLLQLETLPTKATASRALRNGFATVAGTLDEAIGICERIAPEHLEVMTRNAPDVAARATNAGAVFIGSASAEVLGDYGAGPNHVLPTGGTARFRAGLSVLTFLRPRTWLRIDQGSGGQLHADSAELARMELLEGHARASDLRTC